MVEQIRTATLVARKVHFCSCCEAPAVQVGEKYTRQTNVYDGRIYDWVSCADCDEISGQVYGWSTGYDEGIGAEQYEEWASDSRDDPIWGSRARAYLLRAVETQPPIIDRSADREEIRVQADISAQANGFTDHIAELDDDYTQWQNRAGLS